ncbi:SIS domain-containing protein [Lactonifactor longoviformis]|uniref:SIS domain-containing protein n=1 Tax=Lactonifactor longoviformis TaxID=341220 RepID=UPI0036F20D4A
MDTKLYRKETARGIQVALDSVSEECIEQIIREIENAPRVFFTGAGRSFLMVQAVAMAFMQIGITSYVTGGVTTPAIEPGDLLIAASCSGETQSVALFVEQARKCGVKVALLTANEESRMGKMADIVIKMAADSEPGSVQENWVTDNRFEHAIVPLGDCLMEYLARDRGASGSTISENHANIE